MTPTVAEARAVEGPVQALAYAVNAAASDLASQLGPTTSASAMPPVPGPRPANIIITGEGDTSVEAEAAAAPTLDGPPEVCPHPAAIDLYSPCNGVKTKP